MNESFTTLGPRRGVMVRKLLQFRVIQVLNINLKLPFMKKIMLMFFGCVLMSTFCVACDKDGKTQNYNYGDCKVLIINRAEDLTGTPLGYKYSNVDFSKHSLLIASGPAKNGVVKIEVVSFKTLSANKYQLDVDVLLDITDVAVPWSIGYVVDKINNKSKVILNVNCHH